MIETLFEFIFTLSSYHENDIWASLAFSNWNDNYKQIKELSNRKLKQPDLKSKIIAVIEGKETEISLLRWIFYYVYPLKISDEELEKNLDKIEELLVIFAKDFSDRDEYNAYKHSLRFYNTSFSLSVEFMDKKVQISSSIDSITYRNCLAF